MGDWATIVDEFRSSASKLAVEHAARKKKKAPPPAKAAEESPAEEAAETPEEEAAEEGEEGAPDQDDSGMHHVFKVATRHARVVAHPGHGQRHPNQVKAAAPPVPEKPAVKPPPMKPRVLGKNR